VTINLKSTAGRALFYELVRVSDVVMNNFSAGVLERLQISFEHLSPLNPRIITCSVTGYGETGPDRDRVAYDMAAQATSGIMSVTGQPGTPPTRLGVPVADLNGGLLGAVGILSALVAREMTGRGQHVDVSMLDSQISLLNYMATMYLISGIVPGQIGNAHYMHVPYDTFPVADGYIILAVVTDAFWQSLMGIVDTPDLDTEENARQPGRHKNRDHINTRLSEVLVTHTKQHWIAKLTAARIPCAPVNDFAQALSDPQVLARQMVVEVEHPEGGTVRIPGNPVKLSETHEETFSSPPLLGQHTDAVLRDLLGKSDEEISGLRDQGVI
jgi:crotonobetainyl-CoA:carnitine CoA-transferase CaiB-like acyl-CoA transferase